MGFTWRIRQGLSPGEMWIRWVAGRKPTCPLEQHLTVKVVEVQGWQNQHLSRHQSWSLESSSWNRLPGLKKSHWKLLPLLPNMEGPSVKFCVPAWDVRVEEHTSGRRQARQVPLLQICISQVGRGQRKNMKSYRGLVGGGGAGRIPEVLPGSRSGRKLP